MYGLLNINLECKSALRTCLVLSVWFTELYSTPDSKAQVYAVALGTGHYSMYGPMNYTMDQWSLLGVWTNGPMDQFNSWRWCMPARWDHSYIVHRRMTG